MCIDSPVKHEFGFTPATSLYAACNDLDSVEQCFSALVVLVFSGPASVVSLMGRRITLVATFVILINNWAWAGKLYWTDDQFGAHDRVMRSDLDGTAIEVLVTESDPTVAIDVDIDGGHIYWAKHPQNRIQRSNLSGSEIHTIVTDAGAARGPLPT